MKKLIEKLTFTQSFFLCLGFLFIFFGILFSFDEKINKKELCTYENLTYSYLNYTTKQVTYKNSEIPIYEKCKYIYIS